MKLMTLIVAMSVLLGDVAEEDHWKHYPGAIMVTGAQIWKVNRAEKISIDPSKGAAEQPLLLLNQAQVSQHKEIKDKNDLVFKKGNRVALKSEAVKAEDQKDSPQLTNEANVINRLKQLGLKIPSEGVIFKTKTPLGKVDELVKSLESPDAPVRQWNLQGSSLLQLGENETEDKAQPKVVPIPDYSILIELGHRDAIDKIQRSMLIPQSDTPNDVVVSEAEIYNRHFFKVPLRLDIFASPSDESEEKTAETVATADPVYLVRPRNEAGGYLIYGTTAERGTGRQIVALEVSKFTVTEVGEELDVNVAIPANCFMRNVIQVAAGKKAALKLMDFDSEYTPAGTKKHFKKDASNQWTLDMQFRISKKVATADDDAPPPAVDKASGVRFYLDADDDVTREDGRSYSARITQVPDAQLPYQDHAVRIYNQACEELQRKIPSVTAASANRNTAVK